MIPLLLIPMLATCRTGDGSDPSVVKIYDLASALPWRMDLGGPETLLPILQYPAEVEPSETEPWGADSVVELLRELCGQEFEFEGRSLHVDGRGRLVVRGPASVQAQTERLVQFLEGVFGATTEITIDAVESAEGTGRDLPSLIPVADLPKYVDGAARRRTWRIPLRPGVTGRLDLTRTSSMVVDYDVEIAQGAATADPIVQAVPVGTRIQARAAPAAGGLWLALLLSRGDALSEVRDRDLPVRFLSRTQDRTSFLDAARTIQTIDVLNRSLALSTFLPEGKALAIQSTVAVDGKPRTETLFVRRTGGVLPMFQRLQVDSQAGAKSGDLLYLNEESAEPPRCEIEAPGMHADTMPRAWTILRVQGIEPYLHARFSQENFDPLREFLRGEDDVTMHDLGPCLFVTNARRFDKSSEPPVGKGAAPEGREELAARFAPPARVVQATIALRLSGAAAPAARIVLPLRVGEAAAAVLGTEGIVVGDYDVEVAQDSSIPDPLMHVEFNGIALWLRPAISSAGEVSLELVARAHLRRGSTREFDLRSALVGTIDEATFDQLFARERLAFGKGEAGARKVVLGDASGQPGSGALSLEVEAVEVK